MALPDPEPALSDPLGLLSPGATTIVFPIVGKVSKKEGGSKPMKNGLALCLCLAFFAATAQGLAGLSQAEMASTRKLTIPFLGLHLGCSFKEAMAVLKNSKYPVELVDWLTANDVLTSYFFSGNHRLKGAQSTMLMFWEGKLYSVVVGFEGNDAERIYNALKKMAAEKYGEAASVEEKATSKKCYFLKDGLVLNLVYDVNAREQLTTMYAVHPRIASAMQEREIEQKANELGDL